MDVSAKYQRKRFYYESVENCDCERDKIAILVDRIVELEASLNELEMSYTQVLLSFNRLCAQVPF